MIDENLEASFNPEASRIIPESQSEKELLPSHGIVRPVNFSRILKPSYSRKMHEVEKNNQKEY